MYDLKIGDEKTFPIFFFFIWKAWIEWPLRSIIGMAEYFFYKQKLVSAVFQLKVQVDIATSI